MKACKHLNSSFSNLATSSSAPPYIVWGRFWCQIVKLQNDTYYEVSHVTLLCYWTKCRRYCETEDWGLEVWHININVTNMYGTSVYRYNRTMVKMSDSNLLGWFRFLGAKYTLGDILIKWVRLFQTLLLYRKISVTWRPQYGACSCQPHPEPSYTIYCFWMARND